MAEKFDPPSYHISDICKALTDRGCSYTYDDQPFPMAQVKMDLPEGEILRFYWDGQDESNAGWAFDSPKGGGAVDHEGDLEYALELNGVA